MNPVKVNTFDILGDHAADGVIAFGAAVYRSGAKTVKAFPCDAAASNMIGIADDDLVEKTVDGFYAKYDAVPLITAGRCRVLVTPNHATAVDLNAGENLEIAVLGSSSNTLPVGVFEAAGGAAPTVRTAVTLARLMEDIDLLNAEVVAADVNPGDTTVTMTASGLIDDLGVGDYILLENISGAIANGVEINRVKAKNSSTEIELMIAATAIIENSASDLVHKLTQAEVMLI
jgi:hypothetical protein